MKITHAQKKDEFSHKNKMCVHCVYGFVGLGFFCAVPVCVCGGGVTRSLNPPHFPLPLPSRTFFFFLFVHPSHRAQRQHLCRQYNRLFPNPQHQPPTRQPNATERVQRMIRHTRDAPVVRLLKRFGKNIMRYDIVACHGDRHESFLITMEVG